MADFLEPITNEDRRNRGRDTLDYYRDQWGEGDDQTTLTDLLADLIHVAEANPEDMGFDNALSMARTHYREEVAEAAS